jgi:hypothetical protein
MHMVGLKGHSSEFAILLRPKRTTRNGYTAHFVNLIIIILLKVIHGTKVLVFGFGPIELTIKGGGYHRYIWVENVTDHSRVLQCL